MNRAEKVLSELIKRCDLIDSEWERAGFETSLFPSIVDASTKDLDLVPLGHLDELIELAKKPGIAELQQLSSFSDLYLKLYDNGRFWIEVLNWWGSDINVHDHDFSAVQFQLRGRSLNVDYSFDRQVDTGNFCLGTSLVEGATIWKPGSRSYVYPGRGQPHIVCHLDVPTLSLLIRTHPNKNYGPQWNYFAPSVAGNYGIADATFRKSVKALRLFASNHMYPEFYSLFSRHIDSATSEQKLFTLIKMVDLVFQPSCVRAIEELAERSDIDYCIVESAVYHRASETLKKARYDLELSWEQKVTLAGLACSFDQAGMDIIAKNVLGDCAIFARSLQEIEQKDGFTKKYLIDAMSVFGIKMPSLLNSQARK